MSVWVLLLVSLMFLSSALLARSMAARRGLPPAFWAELGLAFGPLVFPFLRPVRRGVEP